MPIHGGLEADQVGDFRFFRCPLCRHPLSTHYFFTGRYVNGAAALAVTVACSRCCYAESLGEILDKGGDNARSKAG